MSFSEPADAASDDSQRSDLVLITDASVEGEEVAGLLRARGFIVVDVPLALFEAHFTTDPPRVAILDVDQPRAIEVARRVRKTVPGQRASFLCVGDPLRATELYVDAPGTAADLDNVFERPVDVQRLCDRVAIFATPSGVGYASRGTTPPPMYAPRASLPPPSSESVPPISEFPRSDDPLDPTGLLPSLDDGEVVSIASMLSPDLAEILARAEQRVLAAIEKLPNLPSEAEDPDCPLPPDLLAPLDEPLDPLEEDVGTGSGIGDGTGAPQVVAWVEGATGQAPPPTATGAPMAGISPAAITSTGIPPGNSSVGAHKVMLPAGIPPQTSTADSLPMSNAARGASSMGVRLADLAAPVDAAVAPVRFQEARALGEGRALPLGFDDRRPSRDLMGAPSAPAATVRERPPTEPRRDVTRDERLPTGGGERAPHPSLTGVDDGFRPTPYGADDLFRTARPSDSRNPPSPFVHAARQESSPRSLRENTSAVPMVFAEMEGGRPLARSVASRFTGSLLFLSSGGQRRIVLQDGDVVTAGSEIADESLVSFLAGRGDIDRDSVARLAGRLAPSGRHAGAALIAQGHLAQDDLWPVLRAHAEWLIGRAIVAGPGTVELEDEAPGRLKAEPSVFGGATGAEVFVEMMRRVVPAATALAKLGGPLARFDEGKRPGLLGECALTEPEQIVARSAPGRTVVEVSPDPESDLTTALWALVELGVLGVQAAPRPRETSRPKDVADPLDDEAIRQRVRVRLSLVREGDYFSLLGISAAATSYEIKRAYLDLRRTFEPSRLLSASTADLLDDVSLVVDVLDEAYDILRDPNRRERYRRAIGASPR